MPGPIGKINKDLPNIVDLTEKLQPVIGAPAAGQFRTYVKNRKPMVNLASDLSCKWGTHRIETPTLFLAIEESADAESRLDQRVWSVGDKFDQIRLVGNNWAAYNNGYGTFLQTTISGQFAEVQFFGTGINLLTIPDNADIRVTIDGGSESSNIVPSPSTIADAAGANYWNKNVVYSLASGLSQGLHTIKIRVNSGTFSIYGFDILNETANLSVLPGTLIADGQRGYRSSLASVPLKTGFTSGTLGTKGGRVVVYSNKDGTIGKTLTPTDATALYGNSATDHSNEEVCRTNHWRLYGRNDGVDFSYRYGSSLNAAGTLDDNCHALMGNDITLSNEPGSSQGTVGSYWVITFKGTGLDILRYDSNNIGTDSVEVFIDGVQQTNLDAQGDDRVRWEKICSGLPYGTHVVKIYCATAANHVSYLRAIRSYVPKKPTIPAGATELGEYLINADYSYVGAAADDNTSISNGVVRHSSLREVLYFGSNWILNGVVPGFSHGRNIYENSGFSGGQVQFYFYGTGCELNVYGGGGQKDGTLCYIDGTLATSSNFPAMVSHVNHGGAFNTGTAVLDLTSGTGMVQFAITNLTLGWHYITFQTTSNSGYFQVNAFDVITPIDAVITNDEFCMQANYYSSGQVADKRLVSFERGIVHNPPHVSKAVGLIGYATKNQGGANVPLEDMRIVIDSPGALFEISWAMVTDTFTAGSTPKWGLEINDSDYQDGQYVYQPAAVGPYYYPNQTIVVYLPKGQHYAHVVCNPGTSVVRRIEALSTLSAKQIS